MSNFWRLFLAGVLFSVCAMSFARTDRNSFIEKPAPTLSELINQVKSDDVVASRYMRHFAMSKSDVVSMMSKFKMGRLASDGVYLVYNVPGWEEVRSRAMFFRKGTLVWTDQKGTPVLKVSCGNPMVRGSDVGVATVATGASLKPQMSYKEIASAPAPETTFIENDPSLIAPGTIETNAADVLPTTPTMPSVSRPVFPAVIFPLTAGLLLGINKGDTNPVPEPCTMVVLGAGGLALIARKKLKKS